jgi:hypothetical protein
MRSPANFAELPLHLRALRNRPAGNISAADLENIFQDKVGKFCKKTHQKLNNFK